jgi:glucokinase
VASKVVGGGSACLESRNRDSELEMTVMDDNPPPDTELVENAHVVGIDIGGTKTLAVLMRSEGVILARSSRPTAQGAESVIELLVALVEELVEVLGEEGIVIGVGVGVAGLVDINGRLCRAPNLTDADEFPIRDLLEERLGMAVWVDNDANCAARAELAVGAAVGIEDAILVTLGTGIGGAFIAHGEVVRGSAGMAGELGHMVIDPKGPACTCGLTGCWERYASGAGLAHLARLAAERGDLTAVMSSIEGSTEDLRGEHITQAARLGDKEAAAVLDVFAWWVSLGLANACAFSDPKMIVIGGGLVADWDLFGDRVREHLSELTVAASHRPVIEVRPAAGGESAGALGAALLAANQSGLIPIVRSQ